MDYIIRLNNNQISKIDGIENLISLKDLNLSDNQISNVNVLRALKNLNYLYIFGNNLELENYWGEYYGDEVKVFLESLSN